MDLQNSQLEASMKAVLNRHFGRIRDVSMMRNPPFFLIMYCTMYVMFWKCLEVRELYERMLVFHMIFGDMFKEHMDIIHVCSKLDISIYDRWISLWIKTTPCAIWGLTDCKVHNITLGFKLRFFPVSQWRPLSRKESEAQKVSLDTLIHSLKLAHENGGWGGNYFPLGKTYFQG